jgi:di/tricarboxylate transporter
LADLLLKEKCRFTALDFSNNRLMTFIGGVALADALRNNGTVRVLTLKGITLEKEGAK